MTRHIKLNIVHNESILKRKCLELSPTIILEDKIPHQPSSQTENTGSNIAMVCGYGKDEPIKEMLNVAILLSEYKFYLTGDFARSKINKNQIPQNVSLTGYLSDQEYEDFLRKMDIIIVLTTRLDTVLCGAYEAVGLEKPLITSDTEALRKHFYKGTIHTQNNAKAIADAVKTAIQNLNKLQSEISELRKEKEETWNKQFTIVQNLIEK
jgi:glycosyltransferase involved in cell wall biosynthesis